MIEIAILSIPGPSVGGSIPVPFEDRWIVQVSKAIDSSRSILRIFKPAQVACVRYRHIILPAWRDVGSRSVMRAPSRPGKSGGG